MSIKDAAAQARGCAHGCRLHRDAMSVLYQGYERAFPNSNPSLDELWDWVNGYLKMEEASHGPTPLG